MSTKLQTNYKLTLTLYYARYVSNVNFHMPCVRSNYRKHTFKIAITKIWEIPTSIKTLCYYSKNKTKQYKQILINSQRYVTT